NCLPTKYCFCPKPMVANANNHVYLGGVKQPYSVVSCDCPLGTHAVDGLNTTVCLCDGTNMPMQGPNSLFGICPPPTIVGCPKGQTELNGKCVAVCTDPTKGMTADGSCCDPAQMTSCGMCCPPGLMPDAKTGGCVGPEPPTVIR